MRCNIYLRSFPNEQDVFIWEVLFMFVFSLISSHRPCRLGLLAGKLILPMRTEPCLCGTSLTLTSEDVVLIVVISLGSNFDETRQAFGGHELWNQVFVVLQTADTRSVKRPLNRQRNDFQLIAVVVFQAAQRETKNFNPSGSAPTDADMMQPIRGARTKSLSETSVSAETLRFKSCSRKLTCWLLKRLECSSSVQ